MKFSRYNRCPMVTQEYASICIRHTTKHLKASNIAVIDGVNLNMIVLPDCVGQAVSCNLVIGTTP